MLFSSKLFFVKRWLPIALLGLTWLLLSFSLYALMYIFREVCRLLTYAIQGEFLLLSDLEHYFFNFFFALIACIFSFGLLLKNVLKLQYFKSGLIRHKLILAINDQSNLNSYFLFWFTKLGGLVGLWFIMSPSFYYISFYDDFFFVFVGIPIVLFFHQWMGLRLVFKNAFRWLILSAILILGASLLFSRINPINYTSISNVIKNNIVAYRYTLRLPEASEAVEIPRGYFNCYYLHLPYQESFPAKASPLIVLKTDTLIELTLQATREYLIEQTSQTDWYEPNALLLAIDKNVVMKDVKEFRRAVPLKGLTIYYVVDSAILGKRLGFNERWRPVCDEPEEKMTSPCASIDMESLPLYAFKIKLRKNVLYLDDSIVTDNDMYMKFYAFLVKYGKDNVVELDIDDDSEFGCYLKLKNLLRKCYNRRRDELALDKFGRPYPRDIYNSNDSRAAEIFKYVRAACPVNIIEWTDEEKIFINRLRSKNAN